MKAKGARSYLIHILVIISSLVLAYFIDTVELILEDYGSSTLQYYPSIIFRLVLPIIASFLMLSLTWYIFGYLESPRKAGYFYLFFGFVGVLSLASNFISLPLFLSETFVGQVRAKVGQFGFGSVFYWLSSFLIVLGIIGAVRKAE